MMAEFLVLRINKAATHGSWLAVDAAGTRITSLESGELSLRVKSPLEPPLALLVSGGRLSAQSIPRIEDFIENHIKGKKNFHKILVIEAESSRQSGDPQNSGRIRLEFRPLSSIGYLV